VPAGGSVEDAGVGPRRQPAQFRVRPLLVVVPPPGPQHGAGVGQRAEQLLVELLVPDAAVEALDEAVLLRLARRDGPRVGAARAAGGSRCRLSTMTEQYQND